MVKNLILFFLVLISLNANNLKKSDINLILEVMKENNKNIIRVMQENNKRLEEKMEANYKRLEEKIKRLDDKINAIKIDLENQIKATNKRIDDVNNRIDDVNERIKGIESLMGYLLGGIFTLIGFMWWDRRTMIAKAKEEVKQNIEQELNNKADYKILNNIILILKDFANSNKDFNNIFQKYNLKVA